MEGGRDVYVGSCSLFVASTENYAVGSETGSGSVLCLSRSSHRTRRKADRVSHEARFKQYGFLVLPDDRLRLVWIRISADMPKSGYNDQRQRQDMYCRLLISSHPR